ncbi:MAG: LysR family transcriptional regulator [Bacteroidota bacterium]|nr:LysR family transcriptional regulator [Bacteroidota bacterium]
MVTKFNKKIPDLQLHYKIWLANKDDIGILGDGKWNLLKLIHEKGSLKAACEEMGYTYRRTWGTLKKIEEMLGFPLLDKQRGGIEGGKTELTPEGLKLISAFEKFHASVDQVIQKGFEDFIKELQSN